MASSSDPARDYRVVLGLTSGEVSGVDVFAGHLARGLRALGVDARLVMTRPAGSSRNPLSLPADLPCDRVDAGLLASWGDRWRALATHLEALAPCVYVPNYDYAYSGICPMLPPSVVVAGIVHSDDPVHYEHLARLGSSWDAIVCVSQRVGAVARERRPDLAARLRVVPYGIPVSPHPPTRTTGPGAPLRVLYCGRLVRHQKRILDVAAVARQLTDQGVPYLLRIAGDGDDRTALAAACSREIATGHVRLLGTLGNDEVLREMESAEAFLLTSDFEGLPLALLEAMSRGAVPVVSDIPSGIPELVAEGVNGFRVRVGDVPAFADRLALLHRDPDLRARLSRAAHGTVLRRHRAEDMVEGYRILFEETLENARSGRFRRVPGPPRPPADLPGSIREHLPPVRMLLRRRLSRLLSRTDRS